MPNGIDPGFAYNPGKASWGEQLSESDFNKKKEILEKAGEKRWKPLINTGWKEYKRPEKIPIIPSAIHLF